MIDHNFVVAVDPLASEKPHQKSLGLVACSVAQVDCSAIFGGVDFELSDHLPLALEASVEIGAILLASCENAAHRLDAHRLLVGLGRLGDAGVDGGQRLLTVVGRNPIAQPLDQIAPPVLKVAPEQDALGGADRLRQGG